MMNYLVFFCYHIIVYVNIEACTFLIELQLSIPYLNRESGLSTWEAVAGYTLSG
ncbi:hypothetical protein IGI04_002765 [Brassica rapa subsp. trilocularis]|uniref:Uncharacterized protein n=1 Tax=Brassica rapa subsp. trilocularis TaxID=1813537 RepID=A0ABQ7NWI6_BRACM|nr:hypothetical protein IGI04_002765 [Brassica rapa subsp. trilocularis]